MAIIGFFAKLILSVGVLWFLLRSFDGAQVMQNMLNAEPFLLVVAVALMFVQALLITYRWQLVMRATGVRINYPPALRIMLVSLWFNLVLPSSVGGDAVRIWLLSRFGASWRASVKGVLADRLAGLLALIALIILGFPLMRWRIDDQTAIASMGVTLALVIAGICVLMTMEHWPKRLLLVWPLADIAESTSLTIAT